MNYKAKIRFAAAVIIAILFYLVIGVFGIICSSFIFWYFFWYYGFIACLSVNAICNMLYVVWRKKHLKCLLKRTLLLFLLLVFFDYLFGIFIICILVFVFCFSFMFFVFYFLLLVFVYALTILMLFDSRSSLPSSSPPPFYVNSFSCLLCFVAVCK